nr:MAG TPA_asm: hypothetical protein [Bacteriophage sp.]
MARENTNDNGSIIRFMPGIPISVSNEYVSGTQLFGIEIYSIYKFTDTQYYNIIYGIALNDDFTKFKRLINQDIIIWYIPF